MNMKVKLLDRFLYILVQYPSFAVYKYGSISYSVIMLFLSLENLEDLLLKTKEHFGR